MTKPLSIRASVAWSAARNWGIRLSSILLFFILARILPLNQLGLFSAAVAIVAVVELFAENGMGDAVVQAETLDDEILSAALTLNVLLGLACAAVLWISAPWLERAFEAPGLTPVLSITVLAIVMNAFSYIPQSLLRRRLEFKWLAARALFASLVSGAIGVVMAIMGYGVTALVAQFLIAAFLNMVLIWWVRPFRPRLTSLKAALPLTHFGARVFGTRFLDYIAGRAIELAVLAGLGAAALALYILASRLWSVLMQLISAVTIDVSLPVFSRLAQEADREKLLSSFYAAVRITFAIGVPIFLMLGALSPEVMPTVFGNNGKGGAVLLTPLAILGAFQIIQFYNGVLLTAIGRPGDTMRINLVRAIIVGLVLVVTLRQPLHTVVVAFSLGHIIVTPVYFWYARRHVGLSVARVLRTGAPFLIGSALMFIAVFLLRPEMTLFIESPMLRGAALGLAGGAVYLGTLALLGRQAALQVVRDVTGRRGRPVEAGA